MSNIISPGTVISSGSSTGIDGAISASRGNRDSAKKLLESFKQTGRQITDIGEQIQDRKTQRQANDAYLTSSDEARDATNKEFLTQTLLDAEGVTERAAVRFDEMERGFDDMSADARAIALPRFQARRQQHLAKIAVHEQAQGAAVDQRQRAAEMKDSQIHALENAGNPFIVQGEIDTQIDIIDRMDLLPEEKALAGKEVASKNWFDVVKSVAETDPEYALELLEDHTKEGIPDRQRILARDVPDLRKAIKTEADQAEADALVGEHLAGKDPNDINITAVEQRVREEMKGNPEGLKKFIDRWAPAVRRARDEQLFQQTQQNLEDTIAIDDDLEAGQIEDAFEKIEKNPDKKFRSAKSRELKERLGLKVQSDAPGARERIAKLTVAERAKIDPTTEPGLTKSSRDALAAQQIEERSAGEATAASRWESMRADMANRAYVSLGIPLEGAKLEEEQEVLANTFQRFLDAEVLAFQDNNEQRRPNREEMNHIVSATLFESVQSVQSNPVLDFFGIEGPPALRRFQQGSVAGFIDPQPRQDAQSVNEILPSMKSEIRRLFSTAKITAPSDEEILRAFNEIQGNLRNKQPATKFSKPVIPSSIGGGKQ